MKERNITVTLEKAREWYNSGNTTLKEVALQAFNKNELNEFDFTRIKTFEDALTALEYTESTKVYIRNTINDTSMYSKASAAMFKLNIIRKALNLGQNLRLTENPKRDSDIYYPHIPITSKTSTFYKKELNTGAMEIIGEIRSNGIAYYVLNGRATYTVNYGLASIDIYYNVGHTGSNVAFFGCATEEIAQHFGKYFGMLITEAKFGDLKDFEIIEEKYEE